MFPTNDVSSPDIHTKLVRSQLIGYSTIGIFVISIVIAVTSSIPLHRALQDAQAKRLAHTAETRAMTVEQVLQRVQDIAGQVTSRTRIRQQLEDYNRGAIGLDALVAFSGDKLLEALKHSDEIVAIARYDVRGDRVLQVGDPEGFQFPATVSPLHTHTPQIQDAFLLTGYPHLLVQAPIVNPQTQQVVGTDILLFQCRTLQSILQDRDDLSGEGLALLVAPNPSGRDMDPVFPVPGLSTFDLALSELRQPLQDEASGILPLEERSSWVAFAAIEGTDWRFLLLEREADLYAPLKQQRFLIGSLILVLSTVQTGVIILLLHPLADRVLIRSEKLEDMTHKLQAACEQSPVSIMITDVEGTIEYVNPMFEQTTGYLAADVIGKNPRILKSGYTSDEDYRIMWQTLMAGQVWSGEFFNRRKSGDFFWESASISSVQDQFGRIRHFVAVKEDITERKQKQKILFYQANYDVLTGLPNRSLALERLQQSILQARQNETYTAVIFLDLDQFKQVNDSLGHEAGDELLRQTAARVQLALRSTDTIARLGGDEFLVILSNLDEIHSAALISEKILDAVCQPMTLKHEEVSISASLGISMYPRDSLKSEELLHQADMAMYSAKQDGRSAVRFYTPAMHESAQQRLQLESRLRSALAKQEIWPVYQPLVNLATGHIVGAEALMRWNNPELGVVSPDVFIPIAEETGLINALGQWLLVQSCRDAMQWRYYHPELRVAINLSPYQFRDPDFLRTVQEVLASTGLPAANLEFEIPERLWVDQVPHVEPMLEQCRDMAIGLSVDDFGTGYSSLRYLLQYPFTTVKIDRTFVQRLPHNPEAVSLVKSILMLARELGLRTVAEGIETQEQLAFLRSYGCELGQGDWFSQPLQAPVFMQFVNLLPTVHGSSVREPVV